MAATRVCYYMVLPFAAMVTNECINVGLNTLFKAATLEGMSHHVFIVYSYAVAALVLFPASFFSRRSRSLPPMSKSTMWKIVCLGSIGALAQILGYEGINYSSPALASAISNLTPAFTFILAIIFRMEKLVLTKISSQAKLIGTVISVSGAFVVTLYKGPAILAAISPLHSIHQLLGSTQSEWIVGAICLVAEYILFPLWYIVQAQIMKEYPDEITVVFIYSSCVSILAALVALISEGTSSAWKIGPGIGLASIICQGLVGSGFSNIIFTWALRMKGPVFVAMFKPLSIVIAVAMGVIFLDETLYLGSVVGAAIISMGFYTVMWGKAKEERVEDSEAARRLESQPSEKTPLLESHKAENI